MLALKMLRAFKARTLATPLQFKRRLYAARCCILQ